MNTPYETMATRLVDLRRDIQDGKRTADTIATIAHEHAALVAVAEAADQLVKWIEAQPGCNASLWPYPPQLLNLKQALAGNGGAK